MGCDGAGSAAVVLFAGSKAGGTGVGIRWASGLPAGEVCWKGDLIIGVGAAGEFCRTDADVTIGRMIPGTGVGGPLDGCKGAVAAGLSGGCIGASDFCAAGMGMRLTTGCIVRVGSGKGEVEDGFCGMPQILQKRASAASSFLHLEQRFIFCSSRLENGQSRHVS